MDNDDHHQSEDDALEDTRIGGRSIFNPDKDEEKLEGDYESPAAAAEDIAGPSISLDDPRTDADIDKDEVYSEGVGEATDTDEESIGSPKNPKPLEPEG